MNPPSPSAFAAAIEALHLVRSRVRATTKLTPEAKVVFDWALDHLSTRHACEAKLESVSAATGMSVGVVHRALALLVDRGYLAKGPKAHSRSPATYRLSLPALGTLET